LKKKYKASVSIRAVT